MKLLKIFVLVCIVNLSWACKEGDADWEECKKKLESEKNEIKDSEK